MEQQPGHEEPWPHDEHQEFAPNEDTQSIGSENVTPPAVETRFDYPKAEAVGHAIRGNLNQPEKDGYSRASRINGLLDSSKNIHDRLESQGSDLSRSDERHARQNLTNYHELIQSDLKYETYSLGALYDRNPDRFANLPTSEFMKLSADYKELVDRFNESKGAVAWAGDSADAARDVAKLGTAEDLKSNDEWYVAQVRRLRDIAISGGELVALSGSDGPLDSAYFLRDTFYPSLGAPHRIVMTVEDEAVNSKLVETAKLIGADQMDRTPRQNAETLAVFFDSISAGILPELEQANRDLEAFKTEYSPRVASDNESNAQTT